MITKNKRGIGLEWYLLVVAFFLGIGAYYVDFYFSPHKIIGNYIGQYQFSIIKSANEAESALFYIDQSAKYSLQKAVYDLASNGGYYSEPNCGYSQGAAVWAAIEKDNDKLKAEECYPDEQEVTGNLLSLFDENLKLYLANHPDTYIPASYNYELKDSLEVVGKATENLVLKIVPEDYQPKPIETAAGEIPPMLQVPMKGNPDIETIKIYHPEVWASYENLCENMNKKPGLCGKYTQEQCCITSGYRHPAYNKEEKGARNSAHQYGNALDIYVGKADEQLKWAGAAKNSGFTRIGIYPEETHIHIDTMPLKEPFSMPFWIGRGGKTLEKASTIAELEDKARKYT